VDFNEEFVAGGVGTQVDACLNNVSIRAPHAGRDSTRYFLDHLRAQNGRRAFDLVTAKSPEAWKAGK